MLPTRILTNRSLFWPPLDLFEDLNRAIGRRWPEDNLDRTGVYPVDVHEDDENVYIEAEVPGFGKDQLEVTLENDRLTITAKRDAHEDRKSEAHLSERRFSCFARKFNLPNPVDESKVDAKLENGVLYLTLHKREEVKPRRIEVK